MSERDKLVAPQEPVGYCGKSSHSGDVQVIDFFYDQDTANIHQSMCGGVVSPLYTHPQSSAPADHTAADATVREEGSGLKTAASAVGVTDLDALVARLRYRSRGVVSGNLNLDSEAAQAIADLQEALRFQLHRDNERITRLEAANAEARELLRQWVDEGRDAPEGETLKFLDKGATP